MKEKKVKKCPKCGSKNIYFDKTAGPYVGGVIMYEVGKDGYVHPTEGSHPVGMWMCLDCGHMWR